VRSSIRRVSASVWLARTRSSSAFRADWRASSSILSPSVITTASYKREQSHAERRRQCFGSTRPHLCCLRFSLSRSTSASFCRIFSMFATTSSGGIRSSKAALSLSISSRFFCSCDRTSRTSP
jgi:hypothetical protein